MDSGISLSARETQALAWLKREVQDQFAVEEFILFGSKARGNAEEESDVDLLIITRVPFKNRNEHHRVTRLVTTANRLFDTNFSALVIDSEKWHGLVSYLPIYDEIEREGIRV